jgi:hypothetical protein
MTVFETKVIFKNGDRHWENVWHVQPRSGIDMPGAVIEGLQTFHHELLLANYVLERIVWRELGTTNDFFEFIINIAGNRTTSGVNALPLFNVVRLLLASGSGRPGLKLLRGFLAASDLVDDLGTIDPTLVSTITTKIITLFNTVNDSDADFVVGAANKIATTASVDNEVEMRQQHRKRRRS